MHRSNLVYYMHVSAYICQLFLQFPTTSLIIYRTFNFMAEEVGDTYDKLKAGAKADTKRVTDPGSDMSIVTKYTNLSLGLEPDFMNF